MYGGKCITTIFRCYISANSWMGFDMNEVQIIDTFNENILMWYTFYYPTGTIALQEGRPMALFAREYARHPQK